MPLRPGMPVGDAIRELVHHGSRPRPMKQIIAIAESNNHRKRGGKLFTKPITPPINPAAPILTHGLVHGGGTGRSDSLQFRVPKGGYVIPADIVSGIGHGNTSSGARALDHTFPATLRHSIEGRAHVRGETPLMKSPFSPAFGLKKYADGGDTPLAPVLLSEGEYYVHPDVLAQKYGGLKRGHKIMDTWVQHRRRGIIKTMQHLKPPVGAKKK